MLQIASCLKSESACMETISISAPYWINDEGRLKDFSDIDNWSVVPKHMFFKSELLTN